MTSADGKRNAWLWILLPRRQAGIEAATDSKGFTMAPIAMSSLKPTQSPWASGELPHAVKKTILPLNFGNVSGAFYILAAGIALSVLTFTVEIIYYYSYLKLKNQNKP